MRVAFTSDIHADVTARNGELLPFLARVLNALAPDVFVLAGDAANSLPALPEVCARRGFHSLVGAPLLVGEVGFAGSLGCSSTGPACRPSGTTPASPPG